MKQVRSTMSITRQLISSNYPIPPPRATSTINPKFKLPKQAPIFVSKNSPDFKINHGKENVHCKMCHVNVQDSQSSVKTNNVKPGTMINCKSIKKDKSELQKFTDCEDLRPIDEPEEDYLILGMCKNKDNPKVKSDVKPVDELHPSKAPVKPLDSKPICLPKEPINPVSTPKATVKPVKSKTASPLKKPVIPINLLNVPEKPIKSKTAKLTNVPVKPVCPPKPPVKPVELKTENPLKAPLKSIETKPACVTKSPTKPIETKTSCVLKAPKIPVESKLVCPPKTLVEPVKSMACPPKAPVKLDNINDKSTMSKTDRCTTLTIKPIASKHSCVPPNNKESLCLSDEPTDCDQNIVISINLGPKPVITITFDETVTEPLSIKDTVKDFNVKPKKCN